MDSDVTLRAGVENAHVTTFSRRERRVWIVVGLTAIMMVVEFAVGATAHSLALTAEGWHMASHAGVLGFSGLAYWYARSRATKEDFTFGTGKVHALAGYTNAVVLLLAALLLAFEATQRLVHSEPIEFGEALPVAIVGVLVNVVSMALLGGEHDHPRHSQARGHHDHNFRAAYLHVLADTLTGILAIAALLGGRYVGLGFLDPIAGLVGAGAIAYWGVGLLRSSARELLDAVPLEEPRKAIRDRLEALGGVEVSDMRLWQTGPGQLACIVSLAATRPEPLDVYRAAVIDGAPVAQLFIEVSSAPGR